MIFTKHILLSAYFKYRASGQRFDQLFIDFKIVLCKKNNLTIENLLKIIFKSFHI